MSAVFSSPERAAAWLQANVHAHLWTDSRNVGQGDGFIAWPGAATDGRAYVAGALAAGARVCLVEEEGADAFGFADERVALYRGLKAAAGPIAAAYFGAPSQAVRVVAITGTNGKTSTSWWLAQALHRLGQRCAMVGTLGIGEPHELVSTGLTTPDPVRLQGQLRRFADSGIGMCALEASSIGIAEGRLDPTCIELAVFTNFTQDHLDYHGSMPAYWEAKKRLFAWPGLRAAVLNIDDPRGVELDAQLAGRVERWTVSQLGPARLRATEVRQSSAGLSFEVLEGSARQAVATGAAGLYNVSNLLGVVAALRALGFSLAEAAAACCALPPVPGRLELLGSNNGPLVAVDYAHTPDALEKVLLALRPAAQARKGRLHCVFGCGGERDRSKRPLMGAAAQAGADLVVVTSDNPRGEAPEAIIADIVAGLRPDDAVQTEPDRTLAIARTIARAAPADVVLLAGKGHETYQEIAGFKRHFSDRQQAEAALAARALTQTQGASA